MISADLTTASLDALARVMNVGLLILGPGGDLEFANSRACELLGGSGQAELNGRWKDLKRLLGLDTSGFPAGPAPSRRIASLPIEGVERSLRLEIHELPQGPGGGYLVLVKDRRAVDLMETELVLASQMRSLAHAHQVRAHDLKGPLNTMQLTLEVLADTLGSRNQSGAGAAPASNERTQRHLSILRDELARLNRILQAMLEQEPMQSAPQAFDLRDVIREIGRVLVPQARRQRVEINMELPDGEVIVPGYRDRIQQALLNLALSGLQAMPQGGRLTITASLQGSAAIVTIHDTGPGIAAHLLDEAYQLHYTTRKSVSGFGLYTARLVVESHGGEIVEEAEAGEGTRFKLTLPLG